MKLLKPILFFGVLILLAENLVLAFDNLQNRWPILGLAVSNRPLSLSYGGSSFVITKKDVGVTQDKILAIGRKGTILSNLLDQNLALFGLKRIDVKISQGLVALKVMEIQEKIDNPATPARPDFTGNLDSTVPARNGVKVDTMKLTEIITKNIFYPPFFSTPVPVKADVAAVDDKKLDNIRTQAKNISKNPISISSGGRIFTLNYKDVLGLLTVVARPDPANPKKQVLQLRLDDNKLNRILDDFARAVEDITNAEFDYHDARVAIYSQFYSNIHKNLTIPTGMAKRNVLGAETAPAGTPKTVYLTFDDGPNSIYHPVILDILKAYGVHATFFLIGNNAVNSKDVATRTFAEGNEIGNHSLTHPFLPNLPPKAVFSELSKANDILQPINGGAPVTFFRPPYGGVNSVVAADASKLGMKLYLWTVDPRDWSEPSTDELVRRVVSHATNGSDILLHSNHLVTVKALPKIIEALQSQGYTFAVLP